ncbi:MULTISPECIES: 3',5'-cyclic-nucleotide phosphodiesterase [Caballeronia]|uniref:3',5'-cyclic-nucleotide phosphodiesterase n=1 Tax=Caballeronia TaxID=1827195 RepID=UPI00158AC379|nr:MULTISPECIES: 3',5'-cyclic-nucleotide phosphodiesterase [Caballeronia]MCG7405415.1 3',5'-cyclic-nucleotide phosphodiesterase [Caballeronia zhejiangensis]MCI1047517.1 3',5'-cyclic-nucleotide phosphodiesterase [Caballeronia zhejiangensis]
MNVRVLGCSGAIRSGGDDAGDRGGTTALLVDGDIMIDAGTGVAVLTDDELARIDHVFLTHSHLDHIAYLPLMIDATSDSRDRPLVVHASRATLDILQAHIFNNLIWPDFTRIPSPDAPGVRFEALEVGECFMLNGRTVTALPARHTVPSMGLAVSNATACIAFSGDTTSNPEFWAAVCALPGLRHVIVETAYPDAQIALARAAHHYCPKLIADDLRGRAMKAELLISHLKPPHGAQILEELRAALPDVSLRALRAGEVLTL